LIILGLDIGGANTKAALVKIESKSILEANSYIEYFPFWEQSLNEIPKMLKRVIKNTIIKNNYQLKDIEFISIAITAELSDAFQTKREGIQTILSALLKIFDKNKMYFINNKNEFIPYDKAKIEFYSIAAANWVSTSLYLGQYIPKCILMDGGSTTIDIIPILDSLPVAKGRDDISRLINHELIYNGGLRATIPSITHFVPYKGKNIRISFEKFALISDVHLILGNIGEKEYINDTADNRSKSLEDCYARLSRIICMDLESISREELDIIAHFIYEQQLIIISSEIQNFYNDLIERIPVFSENPLFVITGSCSEFLIKKALERLGFNNIRYFTEVTHISDTINSSAFAVAGALYNQLNNR
jgi:probable H4MPT-linked C1 transfer pathway protein